MNRKRFALMLVVFLIGLSAIFLFLQRKDSESTQIKALKVSTTKQMLEMLVVEGADTRQDYDREVQFGADWTSGGPGNCNTRNMVLARDSITQVAVKGDCDVTSGKWRSEYGNRSYFYSQASSLQIDHMVPLKEAWMSGASQWTQKDRLNFANDLGYSHALLAVFARHNKKKKEREPEKYRPSDKDYQCQYVGYWIAVKYRWDLSVDSAEKNFLEKKISSCGARSNVEVPDVALTESVPTGIVSTPVTSSTSLRFANCAEAKANGQGPYVKGQDPEYDWFRDGDGDGITCDSN